MLVAFRAIPYREARLFANRHPSSITLTQSFSYDRTWVVSVTEPRAISYGSAIYEAETDNVLPLEFEDIDLDDWQSNGIAPVTVDGNPLRVFTAEQAKRVCSFVRRAHAAPGADWLVVNCMAGVSRSGAIVEFARQVCGGSYDLFRAMNPQIVPNAYVGRLLREAWESES